jgi:hypothetical protein
MFTIEAILHPVNDLQSADNAKLTTERTLARKELTEELLSVDENQKVAFSGIYPHVLHVLLPAGEGLAVPCEYQRHGDSLQERQGSRRLGGNRSTIGSRGFEGVL